MYEYENDNENDDYEEYGEYENINENEQQGFENNYVNKGYIPFFNNQSNLNYQQYDDDFEYYQ